MGKVALIGGYGSGLGKGLADEFLSAGYQVATLSRTSKPRDKTLNIVCDLTERNQAEKAIQKVIDSLGPIDTYIHNTQSLHIASFEETSPGDFERVWRNTFLTAIHATQYLLPHMLEQKKGCILFSGATAALKGGKNFSAFATAKFSIRALSQSLAREYHSKGIHITHVILDGLMKGTPSVERFNGSDATSIDPHDAAKSFIALANQPRSTWTQELDLRPHSESF